MLFLTLFVLSVTITIVTTVVGQLRIWQVNRKFTLSHGAKRPLRLSRWQNIKQQITNLKRHTWLDMWCERYSTVGTTFESASVSLDQIIFTIDPENIKAILATDFKTFGLGERRRNLLGPLIGTGIFTADGQAWEHSRSLIRPSFTKMRISDLSVFEKHFQDLMTALPGVDEHSGLIDADLAPLFFRMTLDSATEVLLGRSLCSLSSSADSDALRFMEAFDYAQLKIHTRDLLARGYMKPLGILVSLLKYNRESRFDQACQTVHSFVDKIIGDYLQSSTSGSGETCTKNYVFLDALAAVNRNPVGLRYEVLNVLVAGRDTTASLLSNVFFVLARRPDIWVQLKEEVAETFGQSLPDYDGLRNMKKLKNVLSECLRLYPPVPFNSRCATKDTVLPRGGGDDGRAPMLVRAGQSVNYHVYALHRRPEVFGPDAHMFRPDRWNDPGLRPGWGYIPFNGGPRICLGQQFALTEASYTVVRMLQTFSSIERRDVQVEWREHVALVTKNRRGTRVALSPIR